VQLPPTILTSDDIVRCDALHCGINPREHKFEIRRRRTCSGTDSRKVDV
jgi:hypothetical protein